MEPTRLQGGAVKALLGWGLLVAAAVGILVLKSSGGAQARQVSEAQRQQGALIYQQQCAQCHGGGGQGGTVPGTNRQAPPMLGLPVASIDLALRTGRMPPAGDPFDNRLRSPTVTGEDREALVGWMRQAFSLQGEIPAVQAGDPSRGLPIYQQQCAHCHGASGGGGVAGAGAYTPPLTGYPPVVIAEAIRVGPFEMPQFSQDQITDEEAGDVVAYLDYVEEERGTPIFGLVELNPVYAAAFVALAAVALLFSLFWIGGTPAWFPNPRKRPEESSGQEAQS
ncbi:MAG: c-type cytochrome [Egibacteraceae bacterium]